MTTTTAPLLRLRPDGTPEMLVIGSLEAGAARYEATDEARQAWAAGQAIRARAALAWLERREAEQARRAGDVRQVSFLEKGMSYVSMPEMQI